MYLNFLICLFFLIKSLIREYGVCEIGRSETIRIAIESTRVLETYHLLPVSLRPRYPNSFLKLWCFGGCVFGLDLMLGEC